MKKRKWGRGGGVSRVPIRSQQQGKKHTHKSAHTNTHTHARTHTHTYHRSAEDCVRSKGSFLVSSVAVGDCAGTAVVAAASES
jgi:hypothetical protein